MSNPNFIDYVKIYLRSGKGGAGSHHFYRDKLTSKGGPDGGDGGRGGSIYIQADDDTSTLVDYRYTRKFRAERGKNGAGANCTGRGGEDVVLKVPVGTTIVDTDSGDIIGDLVEDGQRILVAGGGEGGSMRCCVCCTAGW